MSPPLSRWCQSSAIILSISRKKPKTHLPRMTQYINLTAWTLMMLLYCVNVSSVHVHYRNCRGAVHHVHLSVGPDPATQMIVSFASIPCKYHEEQAPPIGAVTFGTSPSLLNEVAQEMEDSPTFYYLKSIHGGNYGDYYYSPYYHHVLISNLTPGKTYYYLPVIKANKDAFKKRRYLRQGNKTISQAETTILSIENAKRTLHKIDVEHNENEPDNGQRHRQLVSPYDGSKKPCPPPDKIRSFTTAPIPGSFPVQLAIIGDIGQFPHSEESLSRILSERAHNTNIDAILLVGDLAYSSMDHRRWDTFFDFLEDYPIAEHVPLQIVPGNHDIDKDSEGSDIFQSYENRFRMPRVQPAKLGQYDGPLGQLNMDTPPYPLPYEYGNAYYSFTYGAARIIMISSYSSLEPNSTQYGWIQSELQKLNRTETPWVLAVMHCPMYNTFSLHHHDQQMMAGRKYLEPLFVQHRINFVLTGHIHAYLRTRAVINDVPNPIGPVHITTGSGGRQCSAPFTSATPEPWVEVRDSTIYGYGMLRVLNETLAQWEWVHTGHADGRNYNEIVRSNATLPPGPGRDVVYLQNQFYI